MFLRAVGLQAGFFGELKLELTFKLKLALKSWDVRGAVSRRIRNFNLNFYFNFYSPEPRPRQLWLFLPSTNDQT